MKEVERVNYSRLQASGLIFDCYQESGSTVSRDALQRSVLEDEMGEIPEAWNSGLIRFLDEAIYLIELVHKSCLGCVFVQPENKAWLVLTHQISQTSQAIRTLSVFGFDGPARQNLRALYEMCIAVARSVVDPSFKAAFGNQPTLESANHFWHTFISKQKSEKFLEKYNDENESKFPLLSGGQFDDVFKTLGVGAHPNYHGWLFDWQTKSENAESHPHMFRQSPEDATELVLQTSSLLIFITLSFITPVISQSVPNLSIHSKNPLFSNHVSDGDAVAAVSSISALMALMLVKVTNRGKLDFDPGIHF